MEFYFRLLETKDLEWARLLHNDPEVLENLTDPTVVTKKQQLKWYKKLIKNNHSFRWVVENQNQERVGLIRLDNFDIHNHSICIGMDIHKDFRGKGLAKPIYRQLIKNLFEQNNRLWLLVADYNERAYHIYQSLGFKEEGRQRQALLKSGKYCNYIMMSILKEEYNVPVS